MASQLRTRSPNAPGANEVTSLPEDTGRAAAAVAALIRDFSAALPPAHRVWPGSQAAKVLLIEVARWREALPAAAWLLDAEESARVVRKRFAPDRERLTLAYAIHRLWLGASLQCDPAMVPLTRDARGAPQVAGTSLHTSLSHSDDAIAIALSAVGPIGVDVEPIGRAQGMAELAERIAHPRELQALAGLDGPARDAALLRLWVRKEALLKAVGVGLAWEMTGFEAPTGMPVKFTQNVGIVFYVNDMDEFYDWSAAVATAPGVVPEWGWLR